MRTDAQGATKDFVRYGVGVQQWKARESMLGTCD
jgi:hypothetical protein